MLKNPTKKKGSKIVIKLTESKMPIQNGKVNLMKIGITNVYQKQSCTMILNVL
uniref:Uncharacterized protein n=1 Tax=Tetranychus urticae TaxID=32264 RepID=T1K0T8_TETUR